ncbi:amidohydrolase family protein [Robiginitalea sediminis]|uniref:amidohydrolase family protein n=1 Tax=Robiginitalea sediminis TaxID=1982593 RepID=UPI000B4ABB50|nr:amidohydrolase family protein [Robiginitalea sediminis]
MSSKPGEDSAFFNVHTHIFTKDHVPEHIARQFVPWPFYKWIKTSWFAENLKGLYQHPADYFTYTQRNRRWRVYLAKIRVVRNPILRFGKNLIRILAWALFFYYSYAFVKPWISNTGVNELVGGVFSFVEPYLYQFENRWNLFLILLALSLIFDFIRVGLGKIGLVLLKRLVGKERIAFILRYQEIIRFANYENQGSIFGRLKGQYPPDTKFVVLPMDMEFMEAGPVRESYLEQMNALLKLRASHKETLFPFVFVDPRRIATQDQEQPFFDFDATNPEKIELKACMLKTYLEGGAVGIKIYPALGYYPFDRELLPLWLYCAQNSIPITTHCSVGPIFYRGPKKKEWDRHPIFEEAICKDCNNGDAKMEQLRLQQVKNKDFQANFTHPLNYCCLLMPEFLMRVLNVYADPKLNALFGYADGKLERDLSHLKINFAHYGGSENWDDFLEKDRQREANEVLSDPQQGLQLRADLLNYSKRYNHWHYTDWFSLITSMIIEFENIYSDISYTAHNNQYLSLLSELLSRPKIQDRVLFGTDFYVVRNHKTEKAYWIDMKNLLPNDIWKQISIYNPSSFLNLT